MALTYTLAVADAAQQHKEASFVSGPAQLREGKTSHGNTEPKDMKAHSVGTVVLWRKQVPTRDVSFMPSGLNKLPELRWEKSIYTAGIKVSLSDFYSFPLFCSMVHGPFPKNGMSQS